MASSRRRWVALGVLVILVGGAAGTIAWVRDYYEPESVARIGQAMPELALTDLEGNAVGLQSFRGRAVLVVFIQPGCDYCEDQLAVVEELVRDAGKGGTALVVVSTDGPAETRAFFKDMPLPYPVWIDAERGLSKRLGRFGVPALFLMDQDGNLQGVQVGYQSLPQVIKMFGAVSDAASGRGS